MLLLRSFIAIALAFACMGTFDGHHHPVIRWLTPSWARMPPSRRRNLHLVQVPLRSVGRTADCNNRADQIRWSTH